MPAACLPRICDNAEVLGHTQGLGFFAGWNTGRGHGGRSAIGSVWTGLFWRGEAKSTYGTGAFILMNTGTEAVASNNGLLTTVGWRLGGETTYALEGSAFIAGAAVQWLRDGLGIINSAAEIEDLAASVPRLGGVVFVPALAGLGALHWRPEARGLLTGVTGGTTKAHLARAVLEGIALQIADILGAMESDSGIALSELKVDGGAARNDLLMQYQADILKTQCVRPTVLETTALALRSSLDSVVFESPAKVRETWREDSTFKPQMLDDVVEGHLAAWAAAIAKA